MLHFITRLSLNDTDMYNKGINVIYHKHFLVFTVDRYRFQPKTSRQILAHSNSEMSETNPKAWPQHCSREQIPATRVCSRRNLMGPTEELRDYIKLKLSERKTKLRDAVNLRPCFLLNKWSYEVVREMEKDIYLCAINKEEVRTEYKEISSHGVCEGCSAWAQR